MKEDKDTKKKVTNIIRREIEIEDDMLSLYTGILKNEEFFSRLEANDKELVSGILSVILTDTARHKKTMEEIIENI